MLWNWNTIGACFITPEWQIATRGGMIGTCFGVVFLVVALELLRRTAKEFDRWIIRAHNKKLGAAAASASRTAGHRQDSLGIDGAASRKSSSTAAGSYEGGAGPGGDASSAIGVGKEQNLGQCLTNNSSPPPCRPNVWQQGLRALLHAAQFTVAYIIML